LVKKYCHVGILNCDSLWTLAISVEGPRGRILGFLQSEWWKLTASRPTAIVWNGPTGRFIPWTMKSDHERWPFPWFNFFKNQITKPLGLSLGVNRMWTKRNDHTPTSECAKFFLIYVQKEKFWLKKKIQVWPFSCLHLLFPKTNFIKNLL
jgi:hypothetical protein